MKRFFGASSLNVGFLNRRAIAPLLTVMLIMLQSSPAQAGFLETLRSIFTGDTEEGAQGNARGGAIRDRRCGTDAASVNSEQGSEQGDVVAAIEASSPDERLILLVPNTGQTLITTAALPEVFVYIPPSLSSSEEQEQSLVPAPTAKGIRSKIDLDDIDSVVDEQVQDQIEQTQQAELLLEFQFNGITRYYSLPDEAVIAKIQPPAEAAFETGETSQLEVRFICRRVDLSSLSVDAAVASNDAAEEEVFVDLQRVAISEQWQAAMMTDSAEEAYQVYADNGLWLEWVAAIAAHPNSQEWTTLLEALGIAAVDPTPRVLPFVTD